MTLIADIASGNTGFADVLFLIAVVLAAVAAVTAYRPTTAAESRFAGPALSAAVAAAALGWLVL
jgi:hypothetical protein